MGGQGGGGGLYGGGVCGGGGGGLYGGGVCGGVGGGTGGGVLMLVVNTSPLNPLPPSMGYDTLQMKLLK